MLESDQRKLKWKKAERGRMGTGNGQPGRRGGENGLEKDGWEEEKRIEYIAI